MPATPACCAALGEDHLALHVAGDRLAEQPHHAGGDVDEARSLGADRAVAQQHARHDRRVDAVVARPAARVVAEHGLGHLAGRALPAVAVAALPAHEQVGRVEAVRPAEEIVRHRDATHAALTGLRVDERAELLGQLLDQLPVFGALRDDAVALAPAPVHEHAGQAERERLRAAPVDAVEILAARARVLVLEEEVAVVAQPAVHVHAAAEVGEAVVADDHERGVGIVDEVPHLAEQRVDALVHLADRVLPHLGVLARVRGMARVEVAVEHVLHAVGGVEHGRDQALLRLRDRVEEHALALFVEAHRLIEEHLLVDHAVVERPGVLGEAERGELALLLREVDRVDLGVRDRHRRVLRIDVDRRHVQVHLGRGRDQVELRDPAHGDAEPRLERQLHPVRVLADRELERLESLDLEPRGARRRRPA